jgi:hypothetical protein
MTGHTHIRIQFIPDPSNTVSQSTEAVLPINSLSLVESLPSEGNPSIRYHAMTPSCRCYELTKAEYDRLALRLAGADDSLEGA